MNVSIKKFQEGGAMAPNAAAQGAAPVEQGQDPMQMMMQLAMQALQNQDCQAAMQVCQILIQALQQQQGGGAPAEEAPAEPVYRRGGTLVRRNKK